MTKQEVLDKYKKLYGKKWRSDRPFEKCLEKVEEKIGKIELDTEEEKVTTEQKSPGPQPEAPKVTVVKEGKPNPPSQGQGKFKQYRVFKGGVEFYWTKPVVDQYLKLERANPEHHAKLEFPEDTDFVTEARINKCKSC